MKMLRWLAPLALLAPFLALAQQAGTRTIQWLDRMEAPVFTEPARTLEEVRRRPLEGAQADQLQNRAITRDRATQDGRRALDAQAKTTEQRDGRSELGTAASQGSVSKPQIPPSWSFQGAFIDTDRDDLPYYHETIALAQGVTAFTVQLADAVYEVVDQAVINRHPVLNTLGPEPELSGQLGWYRKRPQAQVSVVPFRRNATTGIVERLVSFRLEFAESRGSAPLARSRAFNYPESSVLASGDWYRFTVHQDGVYRITYEFLRDMGLPMEGLASDQINLYGNHTGMLPFENPQLPPTDLIANRILVLDGGDGQFGPGDQILFYASGPQRWELDAGGQRFRHTKNVFSDSASYFVGIGVEPPRRIASAALSDLPANHQVTAFNDRQFLERDLVNLIKSGRTWYGEHFDLTTTYNFLFQTPFLRCDEPVLLTVDVVGRTLGTGNSSTFSLTAGDGFSTNFPVQGVSENYTAAIGRPFQGNYQFTTCGSNVPVSLTFNKFNPVTSVAWLNYLELNCRRDLRFVGDQLGFRDLPSVGPGNVAEFTLTDAQNVAYIWEVTDPTDVREVQAAVQGNNRLFKVATDELRQFVAFRTNNIPLPRAVGPVPNQDLHATILPTDLVIVVPDEFQGEALRLAEQRASEGLSVLMVSPQQVYNEFSCGARDATAIKRFMKMLYDKAGMDEDLMPRYLLLFGDGSYNNWSLAPTNQSYIPSYQTTESLNPTQSYVSDDYFGLLDDSEGEATGDLVDIGIGRLPVSSRQQAREVVNKILRYDALMMLSSGGDICSTSGDGGASDWRTRVLFVSDDQDGDSFEGTIHMLQSNTLALRVENETPCYNVEKIYLDAYQQVSTPGGQRYPDASRELRETVQRGALMVNYVGHGGEVGWAHERFLDNSTILGWTNIDRLALFMTATCEFSRWDDPGRTSAGEWVLLNPNGGGVALMTTTRLAFSSQNFTLSNFFYNHALQETQTDGRPMLMGDVFRLTKRQITSAQPNQRNHRNFALLGDPSMRLARPRLEARITSITDTLGTPLDTLKAFSTVRMTGFIDDGSGQPKEDFNGLVVPTVFDKEVAVSTLANDGGSPFQFGLRNRTIYRGKASVVNGTFNFTFVVPKDINYAFGPGRVSCYAESFTANACGYRNDPIVGGTDDSVLLDEEGPRIELYMNNETFVRGGITNESPMILAKLFDDNGINTLGSGIGHDLTAVLNDNTDRVIVLNDSYEADLDTYKSGNIRHRLRDLGEGPYTLRVKAWDVFNNSSEAETDFVVANSAELALAHVLNYPNPFTTYTEFFFEHNKPCNALDVQVQVFTVAGRLVKTLSQRLLCDGFRSDGMAWDGRDDFGDKLGRGVYVYRLHVTTPEGEKAEKFEKLVILR